MFLDTREIKAKKYLFPFVVVMIFVSAFLLRIYHLDYLDLWRDESFSVNVANENIKSLINTSVNDTQPPFHLLLLHYWMKVFGDGEFSVRFLSLTFGLVALGFIYLLAKRYFQNKNLVWLTLLLAATSPVMIFYSQEARAYSMVIAFSAGFFYFGLKLRDKEDKLINWLMLVLLAVCGLYTHNLFVVVIAAYTLLMALTLLNKYKAKILMQKIFLKYLLAYLGMLILFVPWLIALVDQYSKVSTDGFWLDFHPLLSVLNVLVAFVVGPQFGYAGTTYENVYISYISFVGLVLLFSGIAYELKEIKQKKFPVLSFVFFVMLLFVYFISFKTPFFYIRYILFVMPVFFLVMANGAKNLIPSVGEWGVKIIVSVFIIFSTIFYIFYIANNKEAKADYTSAISFINENIDPTTDGIIHPHAASFHSFTYYKVENDYIYNPERNLAYYEGLAAIKESDYLDGELTQFQKIFTPLEWDDSGFEEKMVSLGFAKLDRKWFSGNLRVDVWQQVDSSE